MYTTMPGMHSDAKGTPTRHILRKSAAVDGLLYPEQTLSTQNSF
jgi:hypothetical protein